jgi:hypothetical protein
MITLREKNYVTQRARVYTMHQRIKIFLNNNSFMELDDDKLDYFIKYMKDFGYTITPENSWKILSGRVYLM